MSNKDESSKFHPDDSLITILVCICLSSTVLFFGPSFIYFTNVLELPSTFAHLGIFWIIVTLLGAIFLFGILRVIPPRHLKTGCSLIFALSLAFWIQGQILVWNYGPLDGREILWQNFFIFGVIDSLIWISVILIILFKTTEIYPYISWFCIALIAIQIFGLMMIVFSAPEEPVWKTNSFDERGMFQLSQNNNVIIIVLDNFQSDIFMEIISQDPAYKEMFKGFTYYPDTIGGYRTTSANIPLILTGKYYNNSVTMSDFNKEVYLTSSIPRTLKDNGYRVDAYDSNFLVYPSDEIFSNIKPIEMDVSDNIYFYRLTFFRFMPHFFKPFFYDRQQIAADGASYNNDLEIYGRIVNEISFDDPRPVFKFYHLRGAHLPFIINSSLEKETLPDTHEGYKEQAEASLKITSTFIDQLKKAEKFDNATIVIVGDHGWAGDDINYNLSPIPEKKGWTSEDLISGGIPVLLIKPANTPLTEMQISYNPVATSDIPKTICDGIGISNSFDGVDIRNTSASFERIRYYYDYYGLVNSENSNYLPDMEQFEINNFSWDGNSWTPTFRYFGMNYEFVKKPVDIEETINISFGSGGNSERFTYTGGWNIPESGFRWTQGKTSSLTLGKNTGVGDIIMNVSFSPYLDPVFTPEQELEIFANGYKVQNFSIRQTGLQNIQVVIPNEKMNSSIQFITFYLPDATSPSSAGNSNDPRELGIAVYSVNFSRIHSTGLIFSEGWTDPEDWSGIKTRWLISDGRLSVVAPRDVSKARLSFKAQSYFNSRSLTIIADGNRIYQAMIPPAGSDISIPITLQNGHTELVFETPDGCDRPNDLQPVESADGRCLSVAIGNVSVFSTNLS